MHPPSGAIDDSGASYWGPLGATPATSGAVDVAAIAGAVVAAMKDQNANVATPAGDANIRLLHASDSLALRQGPPEGMIMIPMERARMMQDCLARADAAMQSFVGLTVEAAQRARAAQAIIEENKLQLEQVLKKTTR